MTPAQPNTNVKIAVIGAGSWGCALAMHLAKHNKQVTIWDIDSDVIHQMKETGYNDRYLPGIILPKNLNPLTDFKEAISNQDLILIVVPSHAFRKVIENIKPHISSNTYIAWATKGLDTNSQQLLSTVVNDVMGDRPMACISGPSFAKEVANGQPTVIDIASNDETLSMLMSQVFNHAHFRLHENPDFVSVQLGGALKNIVAIAVGMADGLGFGTNTTSALMTIGLDDIAHLGEVMGADKASFIGFSGLGDLILTCTDNQSRNRRFGLALSEGKTEKEALESIGQVVEGLQNIELALSLAKTYQVNLSIAENLDHVLKGKISPQEAIKQMLS